MEVRIKAATDLGKKRQLNEDCFGVVEEKSLYFVCDGMGGHAAGDFASKMAVETVTSHINSCEQDDYMVLHTAIEERIPERSVYLVESIRIANRRLFDTAVEHPALRGMGTTIAAVMLDIKSVYIAHVGDSRVYRLRNGVLTQLTQDHSWVNELLEDKEINEEEARNFKQKNVITRALGTRPSVKVDLRVDELLEKDLFLICSDGLTGEVPDEKILQIILDSKGDLDLAAGNLIKEANAAGGSDNITLILIEVVQPTHTDRPTEIIERLTIAEETEEFLVLEDDVLKKVYGKVPVKIEKKEAPVDVKQKKASYLWVGAIIIGLILANRFFFSKPSQVKTPASEVKRTEGVIIIDTVPPGAEIMIDGEVIQQITPAELTLDKKQKSYDVRLSLNGYEEKTVKVDVVPNDRVNVSELLVPETELNMILGLGAEYPDDAMLYADGKKTDVTVSKLGIIRKMAFTPGEHNISLKDSSGTVLWSKKIVLTKGEVRNIEIE